MNLRGSQELRHTARTVASGGELAIVSMAKFGGLLIKLGRHPKFRTPTDILTACANGTVATLLGNGDGTFAAPSPTVLPYQSNGTLAIMDLNGDAKLDLATVTADNPGNDTLNIALGNGDGTFQSAGAQPAGFNTFPNDFFAIGDFNSDGLPDFAITGSLIGNMSPRTVLLQSDLDETRSS